jgi:hypothetical protein
MVLGLEDGIMLAKHVLYYLHPVPSPAFVIFPIWFHVFAWKDLDHNPI